jgi:hypothetical protein
MSTASWISLPELGSYLENYNFNLNPLVLTFTSDLGASVKLINGALPLGLRWKKVNNTIVLEGQSEGVADTTASNFTLRITDPDGTIADRTFYITILPFAVSPSWQGQDSFLGYATIGKTATYTVVATIGINAPIVYRLIQAPAGMVINTVTGVITYTPPLIIIPSGLTEPYSVTYSFKIRATANSQYEDIPVTITALESGHPPVWETVAGQLGTFISGKYVETTVAAYDPDDNTIVYSLIDVDQSFPFTLTTTGFLYGAAPFYADETTIPFSIRATSANGITERTFDLLITQDTTGGLLVWNSNTTVFGTILDGNTIELEVGAITTRPGRVVNHRLIGGTLPPTLTLNNSQGKIAGFVEYHALPRNYVFEIEANDGLQNIARKYQVTVDRSINDQFLSVGFPLMNEIKTALVETRRAMFDMPSLIPYSNTLRDDAATEMSLIKGLSYTGYDPDLVFLNSSLYLASTTLTFGNSSNVVTDSAGTLFYYREVIDPLDGVDYVLDNSNSQLTIYPPSLDNMRRSLKESFAYANNGRGSAAQLLPLINFETTGISDVQIIYNGDNYYFAPTLQIIGTGTGAKLSCTITIKSVSVETSTFGWALNDTVDFFVDKNHIVQLTATEVDPQSRLVSLAVTNTVEFNIFPVDRKTIINAIGATAEVVFNLGISTISVIEQGSGYADTGTTIELIGNEILEPWETEWQPYLPIDSVFSVGNLRVSANETESTLSILGSKSWKVQHLAVTAEGKTWTGNTVFDQDICSFDGAQTRFVEWLEPYNTVFDLNSTVFEQTGTRFDDNPEFIRTAYDQWGDTIFDAENTIFDFYDTILDMAGPTSKSITEVKKLYKLTSQQISGNNQVT